MESRLVIARGQGRSREANIKGQHKGVPWSDTVVPSVWQCLYKSIHGMKSQRTTDTQMNVKNGAK